MLFGGCLEERQSPKRFETDDKKAAKATLLNATIADKKRRHLEALETRSINGGRFYMPL